MAPRNLLPNMDSEMGKCFVGPMPIKEFLDKFLPVQIPAGRRGQLPGFGVMGGLKLESQMYDTFVRSFSSTSGFVSLIILYLV